MKNKLPIAFTERIPLDSTGIYSYVKLMSPDVSQRKAVIAKAMWDTGATLSTISSRIFKELKLPAGDNIKLSAPFGSLQSFKSKALVSICKNGVRIDTTVAIADFSDCKDKTEVTLGLDFISKGDFALSHDENGFPIFSFSYPPRLEIDFTKIAESLNIDVASKQYID